jgi:hypothetical protein
VTLQDAALADVAGAGDTVLFTPDAQPVMVQSLLRHAMSEVISDGIINCLIVTSSAEANIQLTRIHEHLFARTSPPPLPPPLLFFCLFHPPITHPSYPSTYAKHKYKYIYEVY